MKIIEGICDYYNALFENCLNPYYEDSSIPIEYDNKEVINHKIYGAEWSLPLQKMQIFASYIDLSIQKEKNWIMVLEHNDMFIVFKKLDGEYSITDKNKNKVLLQVSSELVSSFEKMIDLGFNWKPKKVSPKLLEEIKSNI